MFALVVILALVIFQGTLKVKKLERNLDSKIGALSRISIDYVRATREAEKYKKLHDTLYVKYAKDVGLRVE